jgi:hypothetical protein
MHCRSNPSGYKAQLLSHLQECHIETAQRCDKILVTLRTLLARSMLPPTAADVEIYKIMQELDDCAMDLESLSTQLRDKAAEIPRIKKIVREQMELVNNYRNTVIAILVALYVPISFVSVSR